MNTQEIVQYFITNHKGFVTGSTYWGLETPESDVDVVIDSTYFSIDILKELLKQWQWLDIGNRPSQRGYKIIPSAALRHDDKLRACRCIDLILCDPSRMERWRLATMMVKSLVQSSNQFKLAMHTKHLRVGFFEGLRALLKLVGV